MGCFALPARRALTLFALVALSFAAQTLFADDVRITTWNLDWFPNGKPKEAPAGVQQQRIQAAADVLRPLSPDILLLQEVRDYETAQELADAIQPGAYQVAICSAFKDGGRTGRQQVVILGKRPAQAAWSEPWKSMEGVNPPRGFAFAWYKINGIDLGVYCVHLKSNLVMHGDKAAETLKNVRKREIAAEQLLDHIQNVVTAKMPAVQAFLIGGDFNTNQDEFADEKTLSVLEQNGFQSCMEGLSAPMRVTHPGGHGYPDTTFDYFFAKGATISKPEIIRSNASDHLPITCTLRFIGNATTAAVAQVDQPPPATSSLVQAPAAPITAPPPRTVPIAQAQAAATTSSSSEPAITPTTERLITITHPVTIRIEKGTTVLRPGMKLPMLSRDVEHVRVRYLNQVYPIPVSATD